MSFYEDKILPPLLDCLCAMKSVSRERAKIVPLAEGRVLEVGMGSGLNFQLYDRARVERVIGVDPSEPMLAKARSRAAELALPVDFHACGGEAVPMDTASVDTVLFTYSLCTIPDAPAALAEARRVLKPGGRLLFCEHGASHEPGVYRWQTRFNPAWNRVAGGCNMNRNVRSLIEDAGFKVEDIHTEYVPGIPRILGYHYLGAAA